MQSHEHTPAEAHRLTAEEVGARVGAILAAAEREARELIASARREAPPAPPPAPSVATLDDLAHALERLTARFDGFELATAARIEELERELRAAIAAADPVVESPPAATPEPERSPAEAAARVRAIDLALAGYSREAIANELAVSMPRVEVEALLDQVLAP
jgi:hypothetical protein